MNPYVAHLENLGLFTMAEMW